MIAALIDGNDTIIRKQEFEESPPQLAPEKGMQWFLLTEIYPPLEDGNQYAAPDLAVDRDTMTCTLTYTQTAEQVAVPMSVTMRQARLQLNLLGDYSTVNNAVANMDTAAQIEWEYASTVDRGNALTAGIVQLLGWTDEQTDNYFRAASLL